MVGVRMFKKPFSMPAGTMAFLWHASTQRWQWMHRAMSRSSSWPPGGCMIVSAPANLTPAPSPNVTATHPSPTQRSRRETPPRAVF